MNLEIKLESFDGPLDLLLHLIEQNEIDIFDIPIVQITDQYLQYVQAMQELAMNDDTATKEKIRSRSMDDMSEFMLMAATLLSIKSKMLLPVEVDEETGEEIDPRAELVERLLEYKVYKYASGELKDKHEGAEKLLFRDSSIPPEVSSYREDVDVSELLDGITLSKLQSIFYDVMHRQIERKDPIRSNFGQIKKEPVSLEDRIDYIENYSQTHKKFSFRNLLEEAEDKLTVIVTFLGVLELMKMGKLVVSQDGIFSDILVETVGAK
ncbi:MAG: segregation/condensation protein A [Lachnospiraceae bacterium]|nr:segregation/condensation protein A [Lachnospiraceae bacterium]